jgi:hypothetical protein
MNYVMDEFLVKKVYSLELALSGALFRWPARPIDAAISLFHAKRYSI